MMRGAFHLLLLLLACGAGRASPEACADPRHWSGSRNVTLSVAGMERTALLYTPWVGGPCGETGWGTGPPNASAPLVINWHGCNAHLPLVDYHAEISKTLGAAADRGYYALLPVGTRSEAAAGSYGWNSDGILCGGPRVDDFAFFEALLEFAEAELCVDLDRVHVAGFSTGAFLTYGIACRYPHRIAAAATDAGGLLRVYAQTCADSVGAVPVQAFHSRADPTVPYNGTALWAGQDEMDALWRRKNGCAPEDEGRVSFASDTTTCTRWDCADAPVESCALRDIDHCWYGGRSGGFASCAPRAGDVDATARMFAFWDELAAARPRRGGRGSEF